MKRMLVLWLLAGSVMLTACVFIGAGNEGAGALLGASREGDDGASAQTSKEERDSPLSPRRQQDSFEREKNLLCKEMGDEGCDGSSQCESLCDDIFSKANDKKKCRALPYELVNDFEKILGQVKRGGRFASSINPHALECMLNVSEKPFVTKASRLRREDTEELLERIAAESDLAAAFRFGDKDGLILKALFDNLSYAEDRLLKLAAPVAGRVNFFEVAAEEENQNAWEWIDDGVEEACARGSAACAYSKGSQDYSAAEAFYCRMLRGLQKKGKGRLKSVVQSKVFAKLFAREVEGEKVCGPDGDASCDIRYTDHFEAFCSHAYTTDSCLEDASGNCI